MFSCFTIILFILQFITTYNFVLSKINYTCYTCSFCPYNSLLLLLLLGFFSLFCFVFNPWKKVDLVIVKPFLCLLNRMFWITPPFLLSFNNTSRNVCEWWQDEMDFCVTVCRHIRTQRKQNPIDHWKKSCSFSTFLLCYIKSFSSPSVSHMFQTVIFPPPMQRFKINGSHSFGWMERRTEGRTDGRTAGRADEAPAVVTALSLCCSSKTNRAHREHCGWTQKHFSPAWWFVRKSPQTTWKITKRKKKPSVSLGVKCLAAFISGGNFKDFQSPLCFVSKWMDGEGKVRGLEDFVANVDEWSFYVLKRQGHDKEIIYS